MRRVVYAAALAALAAAVPLAPAAAQAQAAAAARFVTFSVPGGGGTFVTGIDPGKSSAVVGTWPKLRQGFLRAASGKITPIKPMGAVALATGLVINAAGTIAGFYRNASSQSRGFLLKQNGSLTAFALPGDASVFSAPAINAKGAVTGSYQKPENFQIWDTSANRTAR
jgi:hypothetical protein